MTDRFERFSFAISEIYRYWHRIASDVMEEYNLKGPCAVYFTIMNRFPDGITSVELGELCSRNKADVSRVIAQMEQGGFVRRQTVGGNIYRARLYLTDYGREVAAHINERAEKAADLGGLGLTEAQREDFYYALELIANNLKGISSEGVPRY